MYKKNDYLESGLKLGLSGKASAVYVQLLMAKKAESPVRIINSTKLHRQYVYDAIRELQKKELVASTGYGRSIKYFANNPKIAMKEFEERRLDALEGANKLMSIFRKSAEGLIEIIEGGEAVIESEIELMKEQTVGDRLDIIGGAGTGFLELFANRLGEYEKLRIAKGCKIRYIGASEDYKYKENNRVIERKYYEEKYLENINNVVNITVRPDSVSFNIYAPEIMVIRLKNPEAVIGQRALFEVLWGVAKR